MLSLQQRLRALLLTNPWFQAPVQVIIEDKDGIDFLVTRATEKLEAPLVVIQTTSATADRRYAGIAYSNEELVVSIVTTPATDGSGKLYIEGVLAAIATIHESLVDGATSTQPDTPKFHYTGHADASAKPGEVIHQITFTAPILIDPEIQTPTPPESEFRNPWVRPADRPPFHGFGSQTSAVFLVKSATTTTLDANTVLLAGLSASTAIYNLSTGYIGTAAAEIPVEAGYNWIEVIANSSSVYQVIPFDYTGPQGFDICELYITNPSASLNIRPLADAWGNASIPDTFVTNSAYKNSIEFFYYEGPKSSWNHYFSGMVNLKKLEIRCTASTASTANYTAVACPDLLSVALTGAFSLSRGFKHLSLGEISVSGSATTLTGFLSFTRCKSATLNLTANLAEATTFFAGSRFESIGGVGLTITNTGSSTLGFFSMPMGEALSVAHVLGVAPASIQFGFSNSFSPEVIQEAISEGYSVVVA